MFKNGLRVGVEFKRADVPRVTTSMRIAMHDLKLDALYVVYPGLHRYKLADKVEAVPLWAMLPMTTDTGANFALQQGRFAGRVIRPVSIEAIDQAIAAGAVIRSKKA